MKRTIEAISEGLNSLPSAKALSTAALFTIASGFAGKAEAATLEAPVFDAPTLIAGASDPSVDEVSPGVDPNSGTIAYVVPIVPEDFIYHLHVLAPGAADSVEVSGITDSWSPNFVDGDTLYIFSGGANDIYQASTSDAWNSASTSLLYAAADYDINGSFALDPAADVSALRPGELLKTDYRPTTGSFDVTDLFDGSPVVDTLDDETDPSFASNARLLYRNDTEGAWYFHDLNGVYDDVEAPDLADCEYAVYDNFNEAVVCSKLNGGSYDLYRFQETTYVAPPDPDSDSDGYPASEDCDDEDERIHPGASEVCDGVDNDCDPSTDENVEDGETWFRDSDGDGVGSSEYLEACEQPEGYVALTGDLDDTDPTIQTEPREEPGVCEEESADGTFEEGETICAPEGSVVVWDGILDYSSHDALIVADAEGDWGEWVNANTIDLSSYADRWVLSTLEGSSGGVALGISDDAMTSRLTAAPSPAPGSPPSPSDVGEPAFVTIRLDAGEAYLTDKETGAVIQELTAGYNTVEAPQETDTDTDSDTDTDTDSDTDTDTDSDTDSDTDADADTDTDTEETGLGEEPEEPEDTDTPVDPAGCNVSASTPVESTEGTVIALAGIGLALARRRRRA